MPSRLLVAHFLRRLLDNDLITPGADRHHVLSVIVASLVSVGAFLTVAVSIKYLFNPIQSPAETALVALDDVALLSGLSMVVMALVAVTSWDGLSLDGRDTEILGPLPVPARQVAMAQLTALVLFAGVFSLVCSTPTSLFTPLIRLSRLKVGVTAIVQMMAAQAVATMAAGVLGFVAVVAVRETLRALTGNALFARVGVAIQSALIVSTTIALLGLPTVSQRIEPRWAAPEGHGVVPPPVLFAGLYDWLSGDHLERLPPTLPPRDAPAFSAILQFERNEAVRYEHARDPLATLGRTAIGLVAGAAAIALLGWLWNCRRLPEAPPVGRAARSHRVAVGLLMPRHRVAHAGTRFAFQTLSRSAPHRVVGAATVGVAAALAAVSFRTPAAHVISTVPLVVLAAQPIVVITVLIGVWQACRIPASVRATPSFLLAWCGDVDSYVSGVRRAALYCGCVAVLLMTPLHFVFFGLDLTIWHAVFGLLMVGAMSSALFGGKDRLPLVSAYEPSGNVVGLVPIYLVVALAVVFAIAWLEREALQATASALVLGSGLTLLWVGLSVAHRWRRTLAPHELLDSSSAWETQHLGLTE